MSNIITEGKCATYAMSHGVYINPFYLQHYRQLSSCAYFNNLSTTGRIRYIHSLPLAECSVIVDPLSGMVYHAEENGSSPMGANNCLKILGKTLLGSFVFAGDIGGSVGLYLGGSFLTIFEILDLIFWYYMSRHNKRVAPATAS